MSDSFGGENRILSENISLDINQSPRDLFNYQPDNISVTDEDNRHLFKQKSQNSFQVEELYNVSKNNNSLNEGQSSNSLIDKGDNNQDSSEANHENDNNFGLESNESFNDFQYPLPKLLNNNQNIGYVSLEENKIGVIQKKDETKSKKDQKSNKDIIPLIKKKPKYKLSNYKIRWRTAVIQFYMSQINKLIEESDLPKKFKFNTPNYENITEKASIKKTTAELKKKMKDILKLKKIKSRKNPEQEQEGNNSKNIKELEAIYENNKNSSIPIKNLEEIIELLNNTYEEIIKKFYDSKNIEDFKKDEDIKFYDEQYMDNGNKKSLFEKYELIKLLKEKKFKTGKYLVGNKRKRKE